MHLPRRISSGLQEAVWVLISTSQSHTTCSLPVGKTLSGRMLSGISLLVSTLMRAIRKVVHEKRNARQISERMSMSVMLHAERGEGKCRPEISASFPQGNKENEERNP